MIRVVNVDVPGPLGVWAQGLAEYLAAAGYTPATVRFRMAVFAHLSRWLESEGLPAARCDDDAADGFLAWWWRDHRDQSTPCSVAQLVGFLRVVGVVPAAAPVAPAVLGPVDVVLKRWGEYLADERGVKAGSIWQYKHLARPFLASRLRAEGVNLVGIDAGVVNAFLVDHLPDLPVVTANRTLTALRSLLRFLFVTGLLSRRLDHVVPTMALHPARLPRGLSASQVGLLLSSIDLASRSAIRDRAILTVLSRLGLRVNEVASMTVDDFDWRAGTLRVHGKGGQIDVLPLPKDVGAAVVAHLRQERHPAMVGRAVFFRAIAPYRPLTSSGIIAVVGTAAKRAGLTGVGAHQLRHSVATATINSGATLEEVAQLLRHRSLLSTMIYAKVDLTRLATVTRPWPTAGSSSVGGEL